MATPHPCPECGTPLDRRWEILGEPAGTDGAPPRYNAIIIGGALCAVLITMSFNASPGQLARRAVLVAGLILAVVLLRRSQARRHRRDFLALGPDGLVWDRTNRGRTLVPWPDVESIHRRAGRASVRVRLRDGRRMRLPLRALFGGTIDALLLERCVSRIEFYRSRYGELQLQGGPCGESRHPDKG